MILDKTARSIQLQVSSSKNIGAEYVVLAGRARQGRSFFRVWVSCLFSKRLSIM